MRRYKPRKKAFIGMAIGAGASILSGIFGGIAKRRQQKKQQQQQERNQIRQNDLERAQQSAGNINAALENAYEERDAFRDQFMKCGGRYRNRKKANFGTIMGEALPGISAGVGNLLETVIGGDGQIAQGISYAGNAAAGAIQDSIRRRNEKRAKTNARLNNPTQLKSEVVGPPLGPSAQLPNQLPHMVTATTVYNKVPNSSNVVGEGADNMQMLLGGKRRRCRYGKKC